MSYDKDIDKYKCGPVVSMLSDIASPNAERTSSVLLLIYSCYYLHVYYQLIAVMKKRGKKIIKQDDHELLFKVIICDLL